MLLINGEILETGYKDLGKGFKDLDKKNKKLIAERKALEKSLVEIKDESKKLESKIKSLSEDFNKKTATDEKNKINSEIKKLRKELKDSNNKEKEEELNTKIEEFNDQILDEITDEAVYEHMELSEIQIKIIETRKKLEASGGWPVVFNIDSKLITKTAKGKVQYPGTKNLVSRKVFNEKDGSGGELTWCERYRLDGEGNAIIYPTKISFHQTMTLHEDQWDKAVFMYLVHHKDSSIFLYDPIATNKGILDNDKSMAHVQGCIFFPERFDIDPYELGVISLAYGIDCDLKELKKNSSELDKIKSPLFERIKFLQQQNSDSFAKFLEMFGSKILPKIHANIRTAETHNFIHAFTEPIKVWGYQESDGSLKDRIIRFTDESKMYDELANFFLENDSEYKKFKSLLGSEITI